MTEYLRELPHNIAAEQALLGAILMDNRALERVSDTIEAHHFHDPLHGEVYEACRSLIAAGRTATPITLRTAFENHEPLSEDMTVPQYLVRLVAAAVTIINAPEYARLIRDLAARRRLIEIGEDMVNAAYDGDVETRPERLVEEAEQALYSVAEHRATSSEVTFQTAVDRAVDSTLAAYKLGGVFQGLSSGFVDLDRMIGGLGDTDLVILAGRPAMGKAQALDEPVLLANGSWRKMGEIKIGDELASIDGAPSLVIGRFPQGVRKMYRITFSDGRSTECDADHLWRVHCRHWSDARTLTTKEIITKLGAKRYRGRLWIDYVSGDFGHDSALPIDPYVLGSLIANGRLKSSTPVLSTPYSSIVDRVAKTISANGGRVSQCDAISWRLKGQNQRNALLDSLRELGLAGLKSTEKFIPPVYLSASRQARESLLSGLIDGDGWVEKFGAMRYATSSPRLADDVASLVRSLGGWVSIKPKKARYSYKGQKYDGLPSYVLNLVLPDPSVAVTVPQKLERTINRRGTKRLTVTSVEESRFTHAQCIAVTHPTNLYVTRDYIVTHNTALAVNIALNAARRERTLPDGQCVPQPVHIFSMEMSADQLAARVVGAETNLSSDRLRRGDIDEHHAGVLVQHAPQIGRLPIIIDESGGLSVAQIATRARRVKRKLGTRLVVVDYLQLMRSAGRRDNRNQEISEITNGLKALAKELGVPVLALSQLSRQVEHRADKRPQMADLRDSGSIEQDADTILFVYRDDYYLAREEPDPGDVKEYAIWQDRVSRATGKAEIIVAKNRHGPTGIVHLAFDGSRTRFANLARGQIDHAA